MLVGGDGEVAACHVGPDGVVKLPGGHGEVDGGEVFGEDGEPGVGVWVEGKLGVDVVDGGLVVVAEFQKLVVVHAGNLAALHPAFGGGLGCTWVGMGVQPI